MGGGGRVRWAVVALACALGTERARAVPTIDAGVVKRTATDVRASLRGTIVESEWGAPASVRIVAGNRRETIDAAALRPTAAGRLAYKGGGTLRALRLDFGRARFRAKLAGIGPVFYEQPLWVSLVAASPFDFALPVADRARTRIGGKVVHRLDGVAFGPWADGQDPTAGATVDTKQVGARLRRMARYTRAVRTHGSTHGLELVPALAQAHGLDVIAGARLGGGAADQLEIDGLVAAILDGVVDLAVVGADALGDGAVTETYLLDRLAEVRARTAGSNVPVTAAERWDVLLAHPALVAASDVVAANVHPYREGVAVDSAIGAFNDHYRDLLLAAGGKQVMIAETGWPSDGGAVGEAEASPENAARYFTTVRTWARAEGVRVFWLAAFDEPWRAAAEGPHGAHWGLADARGRLKPFMRAALAGRTVARTWSPGPIDGPGDPTMDVTTLPPYGSFVDLEGRVTHVVPADYGIVVYILVAERWWVKPRDIEPVTPLGPHGTFTIDVTTGGEDELATRFAVFLIPLSYSPPLLLGAPSLPPELYDNAAAVVELDRPAP